MEPFHITEQHWNDCFKVEAPESPWASTSGWQLTPRVASALYEEISWLADRFAALPHYPFHRVGANFADYLPWLDGLIPTSEIVPPDLGRLYDFAEATLLICFALENGDTPLPMSYFGEAVMRWAFLRLPERMRRNDELEMWGDLPDHREIEYLDEIFSVCVMSRAIDQLYGEGALMPDELALDPQEQFLDDLCDLFPDGFRPLIEVDEYCRPSWCWTTCVVSTYES